MCWGEEGQSWSRVLFLRQTGAVRAVNKWFPENSSFLFLFPFFSLQEVCLKFPEFLMLNNINTKMNTSELLVLILKSWHVWVSFFLSVILSCLRSCFLLVSCFLSISCFSPPSCFLLDFPLYLSLSPCLFLPPSPSLPSIFFPFSYAPPLHPPFFPPLVFGNSFFQPDCVRDIVAGKRNK